MTLLQCYETSQGEGLDGWKAVQKSVIMTPEVRFAPCVLRTVKVFIYNLVCLKQTSLKQVHS